jgi:hypothetical protein
MADTCELVNETLKHTQVRMSTDHQSPIVTHSTPHGMSLTESPEGVFHSVALSVALPDSVETNTPIII